MVGGPDPPGLSSPDRQRQLRASPNGSLIGEVRELISPAPGQPKRYDYEYRCNDTANLFVCLDAHRPWRHVTVTDQRTAADSVARMRELADIYYPDAAQIRVVLDNLSMRLRGRCLDRRIAERETLVAEVDAWQRQRNDAGTRVQWKFTSQDARKKLGRAYPNHQHVIISVQRYLNRVHFENHGSVGSQSGNAAVYGASGPNCQTTVSKLDGV